MGVLVSYKCKECGFFVDDIAIGPGFGAFQKEVICKDCGSVESRPIDSDGNIPDKWRKCGKCNSTNIKLWDFTCPKCGSKDMETDTYGFWD